MDKLQFVYTSEMRPVVHAYWVEEPDRMRHWHCSNCGCVVGPAKSAYKYCYQCGAKMYGDT